MSEESSMRTSEARITELAPSCITFGAGDGHVSIFQDGHVELVGVELDEAAKAFWEAVERNFQNR